MTDDELKALFVTLREENAAIREENAAAHAETRRHFDVSTEELKKEVRVVAEAVAQFDEKMDREIESAREERRRGFAETQAMIQVFSRGARSTRLQDRGAPA